MNICSEFLNLLPKFEWFIKKYFGENTIDYLKELANNNQDTILVNKLNDIWFVLPDDEFNIKENPKGWNEFLSLIEN